MINGEYSGQKNKHIIHARFFAALMGFTELSEN